MALAATVGAAATMLNQRPGAGTITLEFTTNFFAVAHAKSFTESATQSRMLRSSSRRSLRSAGVAPTPNSWSKMTRGSRTIGSGSSGDAQLIESV